MRVLHVEDNTFDQQAICSAIQTTECCHILTSACSLEKAIDEIRARQPDVVLLDLDVPNRHGLDTFRTLHTIYPTIPIVILTDIDDMSSARTAISLGAQDYLVKQHLQPAAILRTLEVAIERINRERQLLTSERRLKTVLHSTPLVIWTIDKSGIFTFVEGKGLRDLGLAPEDLLDKSVMECFGSEPQLREIIQRVLSGEAFTATYSALGRHYETTASPERNGQGQLLGVSGLTIDITERVEAEIARGKTEQMYADAVRASNAGLWDWDIIEDRLTYSQEIEEHLIGENAALRAPDNIQEFLSLLHPEDQPRIAQLLTEHLERGGAYEAEFRFPYKKGGYRWIHARGEARRDDSGKPIRMIGTLSDISDRKSAEQEVSARNRQIAALAELGRIALTATDAREVMTAAVRLVAQSLDVEFAKVQEYLAETNELKIQTAYGFDENVTGLIQPAAEIMQEGTTLQKREQVEVQDAEAEHQFSPSPLLVRHGARSGLTTIIPGESGRYGVLGAHSTHPRDFTTDDHIFLDSVAHIISSSHIRARAEENIRHAYDATLEGWSRALDLRDHETEGHSKRVTEATLMLARAMGMNDDELVQVRRGCLLHDIGKMGVPDSILLKRGPLTEEEWMIMRRHPQYAYDLLYPVRYLRPALDIPYCHHEKWDGTGYPRGLAGENIPLAARAFAIIDVWDALLSDRPYRSGWPLEKVQAYIHANSGAHFDPEVVRVFSSIDLK